MMRRVHLELALSLGCAALSLLGYATARGYGGGSGMLPSAVLLIATALSAIWFLQSVIELRRTPVEGPAPDPLRISPAQLGRFAALILGTALVVLGIDSIGFFTAGLILLPAMAVALGYRAPGPIAVATLCFIALLYGVFHLLLKLPLPPEAVLSLLG
ncbi:tripartite tricarboxylate transporter TctB family protein [Frigidibacter oleivorans]|uniref:tripartite tricarboxylate transporter TctB family protein n=1 Tax=Frigidibacter oleivorans TaxID=2487129 RepID=UPI000F8C5BD4|nr:tripartite tricarboxylate transporter TctB family protein [Frigidibacter oleivorans]